MIPGAEELLSVTRTDDMGWQHASAGGGFNHREDYLWLGTSHDGGGGVIVHEWFHFFEHVSTPLGFFRSELHHQQMSRVTAFLSEYTEAVHIPVYDWASAFRRAGNSHPTVRNPSLFDSHITKNIAPWTRCAWLEEALDLDGVKPNEAKVDTLAKTAA